MSDITTGIGELALSKQDGGLPTTLTADSAPGESGLTVINVRFQGSFHLTATLRHQLVCFQWPLSQQLPFECRMADRTLAHKPPPGSLANCSAGIYCAADAEGSVNAIQVAINPVWTRIPAAYSRES